MVGLPALDTRLCRRPRASSPVWPGGASSLGDGAWVLEPAPLRASLDSAVTHLETWAGRRRLSEPQSPFLYKGQNSISYTHRLIVRIK